MDSTQDSDLAPIFGDLSQSEKLSEIKPPLKLYNGSIRGEKGFPRVLLCLFHSSLRQRYLWKVPKYFIDIN